MTIFTSTYEDLPLEDISITERVFRGVEGRGEAAVLTDGPSGRVITATGFVSMVKSLAGGLVAKNPGTVALMAPNIPEYCVVFHGVAYAGGCVTTINPTYTEHEVRHQLIDSSATLMITVPAFLEVSQAAIVGTAVTEIVVIGEAEGATSLSALMGAPLDAQIPVDWDTHTVVLPYSSGTTGLPKGVMLSHRNLVSNVDAMLTVIPVEPGDVTSAFLPFFHIFGMTALMNGHLGAGASLVTLPRFDMELFLQIAQDHKVKRLWTVPPVVLALAKLPVVDEYDLSSVDEILSGAAPLGAALCRAVEDRIGCTAIQGYGMTELSPVSHGSNKRRTKPGAAGVSAPNTECKILDVATGEPLGVGQEGALLVRGPQVMQGYLNNESATAETIDSEGWLHTGDIGFFDEDGFLFIVDRLKELIKFKGFQVAPAEIEACLMAHDAVGDAGVIGVPDDEAGEVPLAFVVMKPGSTPDEDTLKAYLADQLASYKQVSKVIFLDAIPKSASGKILRRVLREQV
ncbi:MAG: AMP-binding protein [Litoreibacter sp.]